MKKYLLLLAVVISCFSASAQLANWTMGGSTVFPINSSGQINGYCRIAQLRFHPAADTTADSNKMYAVTPQGGFFTTLDGGNNWTVKSGTESYTGSNASLCIDYTNDQVIYMGTGDPDYYLNGDGIYKSIDGGATFSPTSLTNCLVLQIIQSPTNASTFVAATNKGIYKSTNNGSTWTATTSTSIEFADLKRNAGKFSQTLFACTKDNNSLFYRSTDFGSTWTQITSGITAATINVQAGGRIGVSPADTNVVYFGLVGGFEVMHISTDDGLNFSVKKAQGYPYMSGYDTVVTSIGQGNYNNSFTVDRNNAAILYYASHCMWSSADSGSHWTFLHIWAQVIHTDAKQITEAPFNSHKLFATNDGGIYLSTDGGITWTPKSNGIYAYEVGSNCGKSCRTNRDYVIIGTQDNGKIYRNAAGWFTIGGGDDYESKEYDYLPNGGYIYNKNGNDRTVAPGGATNTYGLPTASIEEIAFNRIKPNLAFMGKNDIYRTSNLAAATPSWTKISSFATPVKAIHSCINDTNRLYVITNDGNMYVSTNALSASPTFTQIALPNTSGSLASIAAIANNATTVYISIDDKVYVSTNGGSTWTDITYNLPGVNHRKILAEDYGGTQELVLIATNNAVYYKKSGQTSWTNYSTNLPGRRSPTDFSMYDNGTSQSLIRYSSFGRAIWETGFDNLRTFNSQIVLNGISILDSANFPTITCSNPTVQFADGSTGKNNGPYTYAWSFPGGTPSSSTAASQAVSYPVSGYYSISLTLTDASSVSSTQTVSRYIQVVSCSTDTIPGNAISILGGNNYASVPVVNLGTTNTVTLSCWVKLSGTQVNDAGLIMTNSGTNTGLNFLGTNKIGYTWNDNAATYNYSGAPNLPNNQWTHVALVITATDATIYVNGTPYVNSVANSAINFSSGFALGKDIGYTGNTTTALMDEVCFYNRSLSQTEIRELMNLTRNHGSTDPNLKSYYQCNETGATIFDRAGNSNATLLGTATHALSTAPVGGGVAQTIPVTTGGTKSFSTPGVDLTFPSSGTYPNGDIVVTRLNVPSDQPANIYVLPAAPKSYYVIRNYGTNSTFTSLTGMKFSNVSGTTSSMVTTPATLQLFKRGSNDDGTTWGSSIDNADVVTNTSGIGTVEFNTGLTNTSFSQFSIASSSVPLAIQFLSFDAVLESDKSVQLSWEVANESALSGYEVEMQKDGAGFKTLGFVAVKGLSQAAANYKFLTAPLDEGKYQFRIKLNNLNGQSSLSPIRDIMVQNADGQILIYPNPVGDQLTVALPTNLSNASLTLINNLGQIVGENVDVNAVRNIEMKSLSSGDYLLMIKKDGALLYTRKIIKL